MSSRELLLYETHFELLQEWNKKINLVSRRSIQGSFASHYVDSLFISHHARPYAKGGPVFDIGTGAGFPGIIFGIRYPELKVTLFEKLQKKRLFLKNVLERLNLSNIHLEEIAPRRLGPGLFLCRAVFPKEKLFEYFGRTAASESILVLNSGGQDATKDLPNSFAKLAEFRYSLPKGAGDRRLEIVQFVPRGTKGFARHCEPA